MFCIECGTELPEGANFCWKCGRPQQTNTSNSSGSTIDNDPKYEICEIQRRTVKRGIPGFKAEILCLEAKAFGPKGTYVAAKSQEFKFYSEKNLLNAYENFVNLLIKDGWELLPNSRPGASDYKFHRRIK